MSFDFNENGKPRNIVKDLLKEKFGNEDEVKSMFNLDEEANKKIEGLQKEIARLQKEHIESLEDEISKLRKSLNEKKYLQSLLNKYYTCQKGCSVFFGRIVAASYLPYFNNETIYLRSHKEYEIEYARNGACSFDYSKSNIVKKCTTYIGEYATLRITKREFEGLNFISKEEYLELKKQFDTAINTSRKPDIMQGLSVSLPDELLNDKDD